MPEPFKNAISPDAVGLIADHVTAVHPSFPRDAFVDAATDGLDDLELKARVSRVSTTLRAHLPEAWPDALSILLEALPPPLPEDGSEVSSGLAWWPVLRVVRDHGRDHPQASLDALPELTRRFSAEFAVRPYLVQHPDLAWAAVDRWTRDPDVHVRRLASEGTRPRLPWGMRLRASIDDPTRGLAVLDRLVDDPQRYVQTSVANHLNDVSKDHPDRALSTARSWLAEPTPTRRWIVKKGLRTLIKRGHAGALELLGFGPPRASLQALRIQPDPVAIGSVATLTAELLPQTDQDWLVDWIVRSPRADGSLGRRVLKGRTRSVQEGRGQVITQRLSLKPVTTRVTRPGFWQVAVQVNGVILGEATFTVTGQPR